MMTTSCRLRWEDIGFCQPKPKARPPCHKYPQEGCKSRRGNSLGKQCGVVWRIWTSSLLYQAHLWETFKIDRDMLKDSDRHICMFQVLIRQLLEKDPCNVHATEAFHCQRNILDPPASIFILTPSILLCHLWVVCSRMYHGEQRR